MKHDDHKYEEDWEEEAPLLSSLRGKQPGEVPEGYFDALPGALMERIRTLDTAGEIAPRDPVPSAPVPGRSSFWNWRNMGLAAGLALLIGTGLFFSVRYFQGGEPVPEDSLVLIDQQLDQISDFEILEFIELGDLDEGVVAELMGDEALAAIEADALGQGGSSYIDDLDWEDLDLESIDFEGMDGLEDF